MAFDTNDFQSYYGNYRAKVTFSADPEKFGRVKVWIPDIMPEIDHDDFEVHLWARPANNPMGGRNNRDAGTNYFTGTSYIPKMGSWVWVFFENGNPNLPYYWGALDIENSPVLAENQYGDFYEDKWTIFKSHNGRCVVISDDPTDERLEITGKKRLLANPPSGEIQSVFQIEGNQTTILLDERENNEKLLIKTYKGDYINFDIETRKLHVYTQNDVHIKTDKNIYMNALEDIHITSGKSIFMRAASQIHGKAGDTINLDGADTYIQSGKAIPSIDADPIGMRLQDISEIAIVISILGNIENYKNLITPADLDAKKEVAAAYVVHTEAVKQKIEELESLYNENDINAKAAEGDSIQTATKAIVDGKVGNLKSKIDSVKSSLDNISTEVETKNKNINNLSSIFAGDDPNMASVRTEIDNAKNTLLETSTSINDTKTIIGDSGGTYGAEDGSFISIYNSVKSETSESQDFAGSASKIASSKNGLASAKSLCTSEKTNMESKITEFDGKSDSLKSDISGFQNKCIDAGNIKTVSSNSLSLATSHISDLKTPSFDRSILQEKTTSIADEMKDVGKTMIKKVKSASDSLFKVEEITKSLDSMTSPMVSFAGNVDELNEKADKLNQVHKKLSSMGSVISNLKTSNASMTSNINSLDFIDLQNAIDEKRESLSPEQQTNVDLYMQEINNPIDTQNFDSTFNDIDSINNDINTAMSTIESSKSSLWNQKNDSCQSMISSITNDGQSLLKDANKVDTKIQGASDQILNHEKTGLAYSQSYRAKMLEHKKSVMGSVDYEKRKKVLERQISKSPVTISA